MINTSGSIIERIICDRVEKRLEEVVGLSDFQYARQLTRLKNLTEIAGKATEGKR